MAKHRNNPNMPFWKMIKEGYDHFEVTRQEPKVDFCEKKYVFDAAKAPDAKREPVFDAAAKCPVYVVPEEVADAVREKQQQDQVETARLVAQGTPVARLNTGIDGGMNRVFAARVPDGNTGLSEGGGGLQLTAFSRAPGTIPATVNPPRGPVTSPDEPLTASMSPAASQATRVASATPAPTQSGGLFSALTRKMGFGTSAEAAPQPIAAKPKVIEARKNEPPRPEVLAKAAAAEDRRDQAGGGGQPSAVEAVGDRQPDTGRRRRGARQGHPGDGFGAHRAVELVRQPFLGAQIG